MPWHQYTNSPYWSPYISLTTNWENLLKHQDNTSLVIISQILMTCICYSAQIWWRENWCWSLLGLKGLMVSSLDGTWFSYRDQTSCVCQTLASCVVLLWAHYMFLSHQTTSSRRPLDSGGFFWTFCIWTKPKSVQVKKQRQNLQPVLSDLSCHLLQALQDHPRK